MYPRVAGRHSLGWCATHIQSRVRLAKRDFHFVAGSSMLWTPQKPQLGNGRRLMTTANHRAPELFLLSPEVPGGFGDDTVLGSYLDRADKSQEYPDVTELHLVFEGWLGDELVTSHPCYLVTSRLAATLRASGLRGVSFRAVKVSRSDQFEMFHPGRQLPAFEWLRPTGRVNIDADTGRIQSTSDDDFLLDCRARLYVTQRALEVLRLHTVTNCEVHASEQGVFSQRNPGLLV